MKGPLLCKWAVFSSSLTKTASIATKINAYILYQTHNKLWHTFKLHVSIYEGFKYRLCDQIIKDMSVRKWKCDGDGVLSNIEVVLSPQFTSVFPFLRLCFAFYHAFIEF